ncbi:NAD-dependent epimerase/dehydratase family protein [Brevibacillus sp. SYSU BS000544]|uniref:NAD-dependent epimerase/dehydratase family protein n=1 Tax=Brevibacillus sp. SYSU BS000544 TaxID=3416443 RepID=UPI003CE539A1
MITGGTGFLGKALALRLLENGMDVTVFGRNEVIGQVLHNRGIRFVKGQLEDSDSVLSACYGSDYVIHCGALSSPWGHPDDFHRANVLGTQNIISGCLTHDVKRLVHVSTPSIYFDFTDRFLVKESDSLPCTFANHYARTKYEAELVVDDAVAKNGLNAITIRPRGLFGVEDTSILPRLIRANEKGKIPFVNGGTNIIDVTYIENVVDSLLLAMEAPSVYAGRKYNITNGEPMQMKELLAKVFLKMNMPMNAINIPYWLLARIAHSMEWFAHTFQGDKEPLFTRYTVGVLSKSQTLDITAARQDLGYSPKVSIEQGLDIFVEWWQKEGQYR